jgi:UTP pyrophosphatase
MKKLKYISHYPQAVQQQVQALIQANKLEQYLVNKYPLAHNYTNDKSLFTYVQDMKNEYMKKTAPLSKAVYDGKINVIHNALGTHHFISRVQGGKLKAKNEIRVASLFKNTPQEFLQMIVVHELAHFKEKEHNKAFYKLCEHMFSEYHQVEFDLRLYLTQIELEGKIASWNQ